MRYLIVDFDELDITWKDTKDINEGGSERFTSKSDFAEALLKDINDELKQRLSKS